MPVFPQQAVAESIMEDLDDQTAAHLLEHMEEMQRQPANINHADEEMLCILEALGLLSVSPDTIIQNRNRQGVFQSWSDFQERLALTADDIDRIRSFFIISGAGKTLTKSLLLRIRMSREFPKCAGYLKGAYPGSPIKMYHSIRMALGRSVQGGLVTEKDPGETSFSDHVAGFLDVTRGSYQFCLGNFHVSAGQGLVLWRAGGMSRSGSGVVQLRRGEQRLNGSLSSAESGILTGFGIKKQGQHIEWLLFYSRSLLDGRQREDGSISSIYESGLHRTVSEKQKKGVLHEYILGSRAAWKSGRCRLGVTFWTGRYSRPLRKEAIDANALAFLGQRNHVMGLDWMIQPLPDMDTGCEIAGSRSGGWAWAGNIRIRRKRLSLMASVYYYSPLYHNPHGHALSDTDINNSQGIYFGFRTSLGRRFNLYGYWELSRTPWRTYYVPVPNRCGTLFMKMECKISSCFQLYLRLKFRKSEMAEKGEWIVGIPYNVLRSRNRLQVRVEMQREISQRFSCRGRFEWNHLRDAALYAYHIPESNQDGMLVFAEVRWMPVHNMRLDIRMAHYNTDSYDSRIVMFENDVPGALCMPGYYGPGRRIYFLLKRKFRSGLEAAVKYGWTVHHGADGWGSGHDRTAGNMERQFSIQLDRDLVF